MSMYVQLSVSSCQFFRRRSTSIKASFRVVYGPKSKNCIEKSFLHGKTWFSILFPSEKTRTDGFQNSVSLRFFQRCSRSTKMSFRVVFGPGSKNCIEKSLLPLTFKLSRPHFYYWDSRLLDCLPVRQAGARSDINPKMTKVFAPIRLSADRWCWHSAFASTHPRWTPNFHFHTRESTLLRHFGIRIQTELQSYGR